MKKIDVVGAAIKNGDKVLAVQRSSKMKMPLKWEFVGGKVEDGETHEQALIREVREELGIKIKVNGYLATGSTLYEGSKLVLNVYEAEILDGVPVSNEHSKIEWVDIRSLHVFDWAEPDIPVYKELLRRLNEVDYNKHE